MSSPYDWEEVGWQPTLCCIDLRERDYDSVSQRGRRFLRCQHERLQSLMKSKNVCAKD